MRVSPFDFSQARIAPESVMRGLEVLDPTACIVHLHGPRWLVGKVRESSAARAEAAGMLETWTQKLQSGARLSPFGQQRIRFAQLAYLGFRPVQQYDLMGAPDGRIVQDFALSQYLWLHAHEDEPLTRDALDYESRMAAARAEAGDLGRAKDAFKYAFTRSHLVGGTLTPQDRPKSGWTRHAISPT